jgi:tight adherence protein B
MDGLLLLIGVLSAATVALLTYQVYLGVYVPQRQIASRMRAYRAGDTTALAGPLLHRQGARIPLLDLFPLSKRSSDRLNLELQQAGVLLRVREYVALRFAALFGFFIVAFVILNSASEEEVVPLAGAAVAALLGWFLPRLVISRRRHKRLEKIEDQVAEALTAMAKAMRAGSGLLQALRRAADETPDPLGSEFEGILHDLQLGAELEDVFASFAERIGSADLEIAATAIVIQRSAGGNLAELLENVAHTVRERAKLRGEIRVMTTRQKLTGNLTAIVPVAVAALFIAINPTMGELLVTTTAGIVALGVGIFFELLGLVMIRRFASIEI